MFLNTKSLERLRELINEETEYRSGPQLVQLFNSFGGDETYGSGFPSRWVYTDAKLNNLNGTPVIAQCLQEVFSPKNFIGKIDELDRLIENFNQYLAFDKWKIIRNNCYISLKKLDKIEFDETPVNKGNSESEFLDREFANVSIHGLGLEGTVSAVLDLRIKEIEKCYQGKAYLSTILMAGSTLEGIFLGLATTHPATFNRAKSSPKKNGTVLQFQNWSLSNYIDTAKELGLIEYDTHQFSHTLRNFRNYIHPFEQVSSKFSPREHTAKICLQVLMAVIDDTFSNLGKLDK